MNNLIKKQFEDKTVLIAIEKMGIRISRGN